MELHQGGPSTARTDGEPAVHTNSPETGIRTALSQGRTIDAGVQMRRAITAGKARLVEKRWVVLVIEGLINTRDLEDEELLTAVAQYAVGILSAPEKARLYSLASLRGKTETSLIFI